jgi:hypothetical protein
VPDAKLGGCMSWLESPSLHSSQLIISRAAEQLAEPDNIAPHSSLPLAIGSKTRQSLTLLVHKTRVYGKSDSDGVHRLLRLRGGGLRHGRVGQKLKIAYYYRLECRRILCLKKL